MMSEPMLEEFDGLEEDDRVTFSYELYTRGPPDEDEDEDPRVITYTGTVVSLERNGSAVWGVDVDVSVLQSPLSIDEDGDVRTWKGNGNGEGWTILGHVTDLRKVE